jgi:hypothetical protein
MRSISHKILEVLKIYYILIFMINAFDNTDNVPYEVHMKLEL